MTGSQHAEGDDPLSGWAAAQDYLAQRQRTIGGLVSFTGPSAMDGGQRRVTLKPAPVGAGVQVVRSDLPGSPAIPARLDHIVRTSIYIALSARRPRHRWLGSFLRRNSHLTGLKYLEHSLLPLPKPSIAVVEHLLASSYLVVDNLLVEVDGGNIPFFVFRDFLEQFHRAGIIMQDAPRPTYALAAPFRMEGREGQWIEMEPNDGLVLDYSVDFTAKSPAVGRQRFALEVSPERFLTHISRARTIYFDEWKRFITSIYKKVPYTEESLAWTLAATSDGYLNTGEHAPRYVVDGASQEVVRHKIGDLLGELSLLGGALEARVRVHRGGHSFIILALERLRRSGLLVKRM